MKEFYIEDVVKTGRRKNKTKSAKVGDNIKVVLRLHSPVDNIDAERLWFKVIDIKNGIIIASLDNVPSYLRSISETDKLEFTENNILEILTEK